MLVIASASEAISIDCHVSRIKCGVLAMTLFYVVHCRIQHLTSI